MPSPPVKELSRTRQLGFAVGSAAFTILERMLILFLPYFYLPPAEYGVANLIPNRTCLGIFTALGAALFLGRLVDGLADPLVAVFSDNCRAPLGRRKIFLLGSGLPLALTAALIFFPPLPNGESSSNGLWLGLLLSLFYIAFTAYVNPYLAVMAELGHSDHQRINLSTLMALFGLLGMGGVTVLVPASAAGLMNAGFCFRTAYQRVTVGSAAIALLLLYLVTVSFDEKKHCLPARPQQVGLWRSLSLTAAVHPFRIFLAGEIFLQFAMNMITLGLVYYAVVLFQKDDQFMAVLAGLILGVALLSFPLVNMAAKKAGKKKVILAGVALLVFCSLAIFILSWNMSGIYFYPGLAIFGLAGLPLAILTILINPTIADLARADSNMTGQRREAMFFGARAVPLKLTIAAAGVTFSFLLAAFGKDIARPLGIQLSVLLVSLAGLASFFFFSRYPEEEVSARLGEKK